MERIAKTIACAFLKNKQFLKCSRISHSEWAQLKEKTKTVGEKWPCEMGQTPRLEISGEETPLELIPPFEGSPRALICFLAQTKS